MKIPRWRETARKSAARTIVKEIKELIAEHGHNQDFLFDRDITYAVLVEVLKELFGRGWHDHVRDVHFLDHAPHDRPYLHLRKR